MPDRSDAGPRPMVGIVVVNFEGEERTLACLDAVAGSTWPAARRSVVVVDNGSGAGFADSVRARGAVHLAARGNVGLSAACNLGIEALLPTCDVVGLLNNDALPDPGWLEPLVTELERDEGIGGVTPRILLEGRYLRIRLRTTARLAGGGDRRELGLQLSGVRLGGRDVTDVVELGEGFWGWETGAPAGRFAWTGAEATLLVPIGACPTAPTVGPVEVRVSSVFGATCAHVDAGSGSTTVAAARVPSWVTVSDAAPVVRLINSTGIELRSDAACSDRDYAALEGDVCGRDPEVFACSAAAVLFRAEFLRDVGPMDGGYFLYYEDVDLCWRGRLRGWRFRYVPSSVVVHERSATVGTNSPLAHHLAARNRLLTLTKVAPRAVVRSAVGAAIGDTLRAGVHDVARRALRRQRPDLRPVRAQARVVVGYGRRAPGALAERRRVGQSARLDRDAAMEVGYADLRR